MSRKSLIFDYIGKTLDRHISSMLYKIGPVLNGSEIQEF